MGDWYSSRQFLCLSLCAFYHFSVRLLTRNFFLVYAVPSHPVLNSAELNLAFFMPCAVYLCHARYIPPCSKVIYLDHLPNISYVCLYIKLHTYVLDTTLICFVYLIHYKIKHTRPTASGCHDILRNAMSGL